MSDISVGQHYEGEAGATYFLDYQSRFAAEWGRYLHARFQPHVGADDVVVEFGCGAGWLLERLEAARAIGIEPNPVPRQAALDRGLDVVAGPAAVDTGVADVIVSNHALEHTLAPVAELAELRRILRPGGRVAMWLPLEDWRQQRRFDPEDVDHHLYGWTPLTLGNLFTEAGFTVERVRVESTYPYRGYERTQDAWPRWAFDLSCAAWSRVSRRRQLSIEAVNA